MSLQVGDIVELVKQGSYSSFLRTGDVVQVKMLGKNNDNITVAVPSAGPTVLQTIRSTDVKKLNVLFPKHYKGFKHARKDP